MSLKSSSIKGACVVALTAAMLATAPLPAEAQFANSFFLNLQVNNILRQYDRKPEKALAKIEKKYAKNPSKAASILAIMYSQDPETTNALLGDLIQQDPTTGQALVDALQNSNVPVSPTY